MKGETATKYWVDIKGTISAKGVVVLYCYVAKMTVSTKVEETTKDGMSTMGGIKQADLSQNTDALARPKTSFDLNRVCSGDHI